ncbi:TetR/AcrR family transcriptional regulator [Microbacterium sp. No. 7]|uniref:TetR/AcrR family transcriptional regulator n=1 Tax=Microbacterium sp. No. 7 TaxID=1714373 RepID=UPI0006D139BD|nr:TetR family transcriptional regulator [Microbacterium sp. No. 7]ALJ20214.1 hypothetical protein AOA12_09935 [Microbacterium sp. No. 7]
MARPGDRRPLIADQAIAILARGGARALTHHAVDREAGIAAGSTSYYFRTRDALVSAAVERIRHHSRTAFDAAAAPDPLTPGTASAFIADQLHDLATRRREHALAVVALLPEVAEVPALRRSLMGSLFSRELAGGLVVALGHPPGSPAADDLVDYLMGRLLSLLFAPREDAGDDRAATQHAVERLLR